MTCPITRSSSRFPTCVLPNRAKLFSFHVVTFLLGAIVLYHIFSVNVVFRNLSASWWIDSIDQARTTTFTRATFSTDEDTNNRSHAQDVHIKTKPIIWLNQTIQKSNTTKNSVTTASPKPMANKVLLGQFNYDTTLDIIQKWRNIWSQHFSMIIVAGPFSLRTQEQLKDAGIPYHIGRDDHGYVSPYENLVYIMRQLQSPGQNDSSALLPPPTNVDGIIYMHDDGLLNIKRLSHGRPALPLDSFITADFTHGVGLKQNMEYAIHVEWVLRQGTNGTELSTSSPFFSFEHLPDDGILNRTIHYNISGLLKVLPHWPHMEMCLQQQVAMLSHYNQSWWDEFADYSNTTITRASSASVENLTASSEVVTRKSYRFTFPGYSQSDFLYVPLQYTDVMDRAVQAHVQGEVFLECAVPTILQWVIKSLARSNETRQSTESKSQPLQPPVPSIESIPLCTDFESQRGTTEMIRNCLQVSSNWGFYHPFKLKHFGAREFDLWLRVVQRADRTNWTPISHMSV